MLRKAKQHTQRAQTAVEYMLLLAVVVVAVLAGMRTFFPRAGEHTGLYYNRAASGIMGQPNWCGDGICDDVRGENAESCCIDCGTCRRFR